MNHRHIYYKKYKNKYIHPKPERMYLYDMSPSEFKTFLKKNGFKIRRDFFKYGAVAIKDNKKYRFRYWAYPEFFVDISCHIDNFDRWANSTEETINFFNFFESINA